MLGHAAQAVANAHLYASCHGVWPVRAEVARQRNPELEFQFACAPKSEAGGPCTLCCTAGLWQASGSLRAAVPIPCWRSIRMGACAPHPLPFHHLIADPGDEVLKSPQAPKSEVGELNLGLMSRLAHEVQPLKLQEPIRGCTGRPMKSKRCKPWALGAQKLNDP